MDKRENQCKSWGASHARVRLTHGCIRYFSPPRSKERWTDADCLIQVDVITNESCLSLGDALRDIDARSLIKDDFVLVTGDVVCSADLGPILQEHK